MDPILSINYVTIASFFEAAEGNFRNAAYVSCNCNYPRESGCGDFLFLPDHDCKPIIFPLTDAENFLGIKIDKSEFTLIISSRDFIRMYSRWIELTVPSVKDCPIQQLMHLANRPKSPDNSILSLK